MPDPITVYATEADLKKYGLASLAAWKFQPDQIAGALEAASAEASSYLSDGDGYPFTLPLTAVGEDMKMMVSWLAAYLLASTTGVSPDGSLELFEKRRDSAIKWLTRVRAGEVTPVGIVDSAPAPTGGATASRAGVAIITGSSRGYSSRGEAPGSVFDLGGGRGGFRGD